MIYNFILAIGLALTICGLFFTFYLLINKVILKNQRNDFVTVVIGKDCEELPETVYQAFVQANLLNFGEKSSVIVLDFGLSEDTKCKCFEVLQRYDNLKFCTIEDFESIVCKDSLR